jgi:hypothetical protein
MENPDILFMLQQIKLPVWYIIHSGTEERPQEAAKRMALTCHKITKNCIKIAIQDRRIKIQHQINP